MVLLEDAFGLILENVFVGLTGPQTRYRIGGVQIRGEKLVDSSRIQIGHRQVGESRELALQADARLDSVRSVKIGIGLINSRIALRQ